MAYSKIEQLIFDLVEPMAFANHVSVWDVEFVKEGKSHVLRVYIDKENGASIDDCEKISVALSEKLDELDPISTPYSLEVSSAGLDRKLKRESDFIQYIGHLIDVKLYAPVQGVKEFTAELCDYSQDVLSVRYENQILELPMSQVASVRLTVIF